MLSKKLVFIENSAQIDAVLNDQSIKRNSHFIALAPEVMHQLDKRQMEYNIPEDFYSEEELIKYANQNFEMSEKILTVIHSHFKKNSPLFADSSPSLFHDFFYLYLKFYLIDPVSIRMFTLQELLNKLCPEAVTFFDKAEEVAPIDMWGDPWRNDLLYSQCLKAILGGCDTEVNVLVDNNMKNKPQERLLKSSGKNMVKKILGKILLKNEQLLRFRLFLKMLGYKYLFDYLSLFRNRTDILVISYSADFDMILPKLAKSKIGIVYWHSPYSMNDKPHKIFPLSFDNMRNRADPAISVLKAEAGGIWNELKNDEDFTNLWSFNGINVFHIFKTKLDWLFTEGLVELYKTYCVTQNIFDAHNIKALFSMGFDRPHRGAILARAKEAGLPCITLQHGGFYGYVEDISRIYGDLENSDFFFAWGGEGAVETLKELGAKLDRPPEIVSTGSISLVNLRKEMVRADNKSIRIKFGIEPHKNIIMYVPTSLAWPERYLPVCTYAPNTYFRWQRKIVDLFAKFDEQFIVKLHYKEADNHPLPEYIRDRGFDNCMVLTAPLREILSIADLFVIDYPSTALLEILNTDKKIILFTDLRQIPIYPDALDALKKRVKFADNHDRFLEIIKDTLEFKDFSPIANPDTEFMREYGNCLEDDSRKYDIVNQISATAFR